MIAEAAAWIGRSATVTDIVSDRHIRQWSALFDRPEPSGAAMPAGLHWSLCTDAVGQSRLGPDGHPRPGQCLPDVGLERRMWAGSRLRFGRPLSLGQPVTRTSRVAAVDAKQGRSGPLVFVDVEHEWKSPEGWHVRELQSLVYRGPSTASAPGLPRPPAHELYDSMVPDEPLLFRFSAVTFNAHRIHYDRRYAVEVEGYPDLVVQGPLIATLLLRAASARQPVESFDYRSCAPAFVNQPLHLGGHRTDGGLELAAWNEAGHVIAKAQAR